MREMNFENNQYTKNCLCGIWNAHFCTEEKLIGIVVNIG